MNIRSTFISALLISTVAIAQAQAGITIKNDDDSGDSIYVGTQTLAPVTVTSSNYMSFSNSSMSGGSGLVGVGTASTAFGGSGYGSVPYVGTQILKPVTVTTTTKPVNVLKPVTVTTTYVPPKTTTPLIIPPIPGPLTLASVIPTTASKPSTTANSGCYMSAIFCVVFGDSASYPPVRNVAIVNTVCVVETYTARTESYTYGVRRIVKTAAGGLISSITLPLSAAQAQLYLRQLVLTYGVCK